MADTITTAGNPRKPEGEAGSAMLKRMNESHYEMTGWGLDFLSFDAADHVLDIGCGGGMTLKRIAEMVPDGTLYGIDYSEVSVEESKKLNQKTVEEGRMRILQGTVEALPYADESFDKIVTVESFYFWPDPPEDLKEAYRVLKQGGRLLMIAEIYDGAELSEHDRENIKKYDLFNPSIAEFRMYFEKAGFVHTDIHTIDGHCWIAIVGEK